MEFPNGSTVLRDRRKPIKDPYNPDSTVPGKWSDRVDTIELPGAFIASSSSVGTASATRSQILTAKSLYLTDTTADVQAGDRIQDGTAIYEIEAVPTSDRNPFTGWQPVQEIPLKAVAG